MNDLLTQVFGTPLRRCRAKKRFGRHPLPGSLTAASAARVSDAGRAAAPAVE